jgi:hypothetical protein
MPRHANEVVLPPLIDDTLKMPLVSHQDKPSVPRAITQGFLKSTAARLKRSLGERTQYQGKHQILVIHQNR